MKCGTLFGKREKESERDKMNVEKAKAIKGWVYQVVCVFGLNNNNVRF